MLDLTIAILTKNEENNILSIIENAKKLTDNILIVDSQSSDNTTQLSAQNGAKVIVKEWEGDYAQQRNFALKNVNTKWVFYLDADERLEDTLIETLKNLDNNAQKQYSFKRKTTAFGKKLNHGVLRADFVIRLFPTSQVKWEGKLHEKPVSNLPVEVVKNGAILHNTYYSWQQYFSKFNNYTTIWANNAYEKGKKTNLFTAFLHSTHGFIQTYFLQKGFLDGKLGFVLCVNHFFYIWVKYIKLWQLQKNGTKIK
jgi:glycosyltransferase involved in cell wall biosynthesis